MGPLLYNVKDRIKEAIRRYEEGRTMTYSEFRDSFTSAEEFRQAFGKLSQDEAYALVSTIEGSPAVKGVCNRNLEGGIKGIPGEETKHTLKNNSYSRQCAA